MRREQRCMYLGRWHATVLEDAGAKLKLRIQFEDGQAVRWVPRRETDLEVI